jgi:small conductance mechanosensitive channel
MVNLGASSVDWQVRVWCKTPDYWATWEQTRVAAKKSLDKAGLVIPFPQIDVHMPKAG